MGEGHSACSKWWTLRTNLEKTFVSLSLILLLTLVIIMLVGVGFHAKSLSGSHSSKVCTKCEEEAGSVIEMANLDTDYCDDFYEFACGNFKYKYAPRADNSEVTTENLATEKVLIKLKNWLESDNFHSKVSSFKKAKTFYNTCMDSKKPLDVSLSVLKHVIKDEGLEPWPFLDPALDSNYESKGKLEWKLATFLKIGIPAVFKLEVVPDPNGKYVISISPATPAFPMGDPRLVQEDPEFRYYISSLLRLLGVRTDGDVGEIMNVEVSFLRNKEVAESECRPQNDPINGLIITTRQSFEESFTKLTSAVNISLLLSHVLPKNRQLENATMHWYCKLNVRDFVDLFQIHISKVVDNYLAWRFMAQFSEHLGESFSRLHSFFLRQTALEPNQQASAPKPRWKYCINLLEKYMLPVLGAEYKERELNNKILEEKMAVATAIRNSLSSMMSTSKYIRPDKREQLKQKILMTKFDVPVLKLSSNSTNVDNWFSELSLQYDHLMQNLMRSEKFLFTKQFDLMTLPKEKHLRWEGLSLSSPQTLKYKENAIDLNFGKLLPQYLNVGIPSRNYGAFGTTISKYLLLYLINASSIEVSERKHLFWSLFQSTIDQNTCFVEESSETNYDAEEMTVSNLIELSAVTAAYNSYKSGKGNYAKLPGLDLTEDQMFFVSYAQSQCEVSSTVTPSGSTAHTRVNFALKNFQPFSDTFTCDKRKPMNPNDKCQLWIS